LFSSVSSGDPRGVDVGYAVAVAVEALLLGETVVDAVA